MSEPTKIQNDLQLYQTVGRIEGKLDGLCNNFDTTKENHEWRINTLEDSTAQMKGKAIGAGLAAGLISSAIGVLVFLGFKR